MGQSVVLNGVALPLKDYVHSLGMPLETSSTLEAQVTSVARCAFYYPQLGYQLWPFLHRDSLTTMIHAFGADQSLGGHQSVDKSKRAANA